MGSHQGLDASADGNSEGRQFNRTQTLVSVVHAGKLKMGIGVGVAVTWEMLTASQHTSIVQPSPEGQGVLGDQVRPTPERTIANDRVQRIGVHVEHGGEIPTDAEGGDLPT